MQHDHEKVKQIIQFIETLKLPDGSYAGRRFELFDWQCSIIDNVYGPRDEKGDRIVKEAILSVGRKAGKSTLISALILVHMVTKAEAVINGQLYSSAFTRQQASLVYALMCKMIRQDHYLSNRIKIVESQYKLIDSVTGTVFKALSNDHKGILGISANGLFMDELCAFGADRQLYDALVTSQGAHDNGICWTISTQAARDTDILSRNIDSALNSDDPSVKCFLFTTPLDEDPFLEDNWYKSNPSLGENRSLDDLRRLARRAKQNPESEASFRAFYLNQRVSSSPQAISPSVWKACSDEIDMGVFEDNIVCGGLDLSSKNDLSAFCLSAYDENGVAHVMPFFWTPKEGIEEKGRKDGAPYSLWVKQGHIKATEGRTISYAYIAQKILELHSLYNIQYIYADMWRINDLMKEFNEISDSVWVKDKDDPIYNGICIVPFGQGYKSQSGAINTMEDLLLEGKIRHGGNPPLTMCAMNARYDKDPAGNRKFAKNKDTGRIDGLVAMCQSLTREEIQEYNLYVK